MTESVTLLKGSLLADTMRTVTMEFLGRGVTGRLVTVVLPVGDCAVTIVLPSGLRMTTEMARTLLPF